MVKGVNKQIVEISNTENEYFERAILFVNPDKLSTGGKRLENEANQFVGSCVRYRVRPKQSSAKRVLFNLSMIASGAVLGALITILFTVS